MELKCPTAYQCKKWNVTQTHPPAVLEGIAGEVTENKQGLVIVVQL